jgi:hypothetical protein
MVERCAECGALDAYGLCATFHRIREEEEMATAAENDDTIQPPAPPEDLTIPAAPPEDMLTLIRDGWRPPARYVEAYRPLLRASYRARGLVYLGEGKLGDHDIEQIIGIMGVIDYLGVQHPATTPPDVSE